MSDIKYVITEFKPLSGRYVALRGLAFESKEAALGYIEKTYRKERRKNYSIEQRKLKADDTNERMHCQCCARPILAKGGLIAHHGYERPGTGWQTSSCPGARKDPWEVSRDALGRMIEGLKNSLEVMRKARNEVVAELAPVSFGYIVYGQDCSRTTKTLSFTRETFAEVIGSSDYRMGFYGDDATFDGFKKRDVRHRDGKIRMQAEFLAECVVRYEGWKQTHKRDGDLWIRL